MHEEKTPYNPPPIFSFLIKNSDLIKVKDWWINRQREKRAIRHAKTEWYYSGCG